MHSMDDKQNSTDRVKDRSTIGIRRPINLFCSLFLELFYLNESNNPYSVVLARALPLHFASPCSKISAA